MSNTFGFLPAKPSKKVQHILFPKRERIPFVEIQDHEITDYLGQEFECDVECYPNYFLIMFKHRLSGNCICLEDTPSSSMNTLKLAWILHAFKFVGFNFKKYDLIMIAMRLMGYGRYELKEATNLIIEEKWNIRDVEEKYRITYPYINYVDLIEVCPLSGSLKKYSGRLHAERMQELPYDPNKDLTYEEAMDVKHYCGNDLDCTGLIKDELKEQIKLREALSAQFGIDLRSKSDAQIAEAIFSKEIERITGKEVKKPKIASDYTCQYKAPGFISFKTLELQNVYARILQARFSLDGGGSPMWPVGLGEREKNKKGDWVWTLKVKIGSTTYKLGMGGIHSNEKTIAYVSDDIYILKDRDVASYYPYIILNQRLFPEHLGEAFLTVYKERVDARIAAKRAKDTVGADSGKIIINGSFGKLGSKYSRLYSPDLMLQVTLTGQLCLLMLIEELELNGIQVISANTDGVVSRVRRDETELFESIIKRWERITNFETEETAYAALYSKDVNNYIAVKYGQDEKTKEWTNEKTGCKLKGAYGDPWSDKKAQIFRFHKNPAFLICTQAIQALILEGTPIAHTVRQCRDIKQFLAVRDVKGGGHKDGLYIGKSVRWYASTSVKGTINYIQSGNKVPDTQGGRPIMDLPKEFPNDVNYEFYEEKANAMLVDIGFYKKEDLTGQGTFF